MIQKNKIKILYTIPNFKTAGSQYVLLSLFKKINKTKFDPYVCVEKYPELIPEVIPLDKRIVFEYTGKVKIDIIRFRKAIKSNNIDIIHSWDYKSNYIEPLVSRFSGVKYLYTKKNNALSKRWFLKSIFSNHIAYNNPEMKKRFFNISFFQNKISFIPHGVDTDIFKPLKKTSRNTFNIGCIGNINTNKNQLFLVKSLLSLPENVVLHLYGNEEKEYRKFLNEYIEKHTLENRVQFHGFIENKRVPKALNTLDLFILPSLNEGLPVSIIEAMACGVPVLSSDSGGGAKYLLNSEYIFDLKNKDELIEKIVNIYYLQQDERNKILKQGVKQIKENHSIKGEVQAYENIYKRIISS